MIRIFLLLLVIQIYPENGRAQVPELIRVEFFNPKGELNKWISIKDDATGLPVSPSFFEHKTTAWQKNGNTITTLPVAYVSGSYPRIGACFKVGSLANTCSGPEGQVQSNGFARGKMEFYTESGTFLTVELPAKELKGTGVSETYEYVPQPTSLALFTCVQYYEKFKITWEWAPSLSSTEWTIAGESEHPLYVTLDVPKPENPGAGYLHFHTLLYIGCKYGHGGKTNEELVSMVWNFIKEKNVRTVKGDVLKYYYNWTGNSPQAYKTDELLKFHDGRCQSWAKLFLDIFKMQGFQEEDNYIRATLVNSDFFLIKEWSATGAPGTSGNTEYPYENLKKISNFYQNNQYNWEKKEVDYLGGMAQGLEFNMNEFPLANFNLHVFTNVLGTLYDPSYGNKYDQIVQFGSERQLPGFKNAISGSFLEFPPNKMHIKLPLSTWDYFIVVPNSQGQNEDDY